LCNLVYKPSTGATNTLTILDNPATHRFTFVDAAEAVTLVGNFINPAGNGTHTVGFGDGNTCGAVVDVSDQNFTVNVEQTVSGKSIGVNLGHDRLQPGHRPAVH